MPKNPNFIFGNMFNSETFRTSENTLVNIIPDVLVITTNGFLRSDSRCVMGRGIALQASNFCPHLPLKIGKLIKIYGNNAHLVSKELINGKQISIISFPVKPIYELCLSDKSNVVSHMKNKFIVGEKVPGWACKAHYEIIQKSTEQLIKIVSDNKFKYVVMPLPGTGAGELPKTVVKALMEDLLDERFYVIDLE